MKKLHDKYGMSIPLHKVKVMDRFWGQVIDTSRKGTILACIVNCEKTERMNNFKRAAGKMPGGFQGNYYDDSDVYKVLEGIAYSLMNEPDAYLEKKADEWIEIISDAQQEDGYLVCYFILETNQEKWYSDMERHEDYCLGHMIEAAVAYRHATGKTKLLETAVAFADHFAAHVGDGIGDWVPGHQEIELALVKLYQETEKEEYLRLSQWLIEERGRGHGVGSGIWGKPEWGPAYAQDDVPAYRMADIKGHAVRAVFLYSAMCDISGLLDENRYLPALLRLWDSAVYRNMYITGGIGSSKENEGFTGDYDLPNETAYCETCAAIGMVFWNHRMNGLFLDSKYADVIERELYNGALSGVSLDGRKFFYVNPLYSDGTHHRTEWYDCSCCPTQLTRFIPSVGQYIYMVHADELYLNQYIASEMETKIGEHVIRMKLESEFPYKGGCKLRVLEAGQGGFVLNLRIPWWCKEYKVRVNGVEWSDSYIEKGYLKLLHPWKEGDVIELEFQMTIHIQRSHPKVMHNEGKVALMRGPLVYCMEEVDNKAFDQRVDVEGMKEEERGDLPAGVVVLRDRQDRILIPYYAWDNREKGRMSVWLTC